MGKSEELPRVGTWLAITFLSFSSLRMAVESTFRTGSKAV